MKIKYFISTLIIVNLFTISIKAQSFSPVVPEKCTSFELSQVILQDKEFSLRQQHDFAYILTLDPDRYLSHFRRNAGVTTTSQGVPVDNSQHYGGWEFLGSSTFGHYLSALCLMYKVTGENEVLDRINYIIDELDYIQQNPTYPDENLRKGALIAFDRNRYNKIQEPNFLRTYNELREGIVNLTSAPDKRSASVDEPYFKTFYWLSGGLLWYTNHKIYAGIRDAWKYTGSSKARNVFLSFCDWACWVTENLTEEDFTKMLYSEHGAMNEVLADAYGMTGDEKYLYTALRFNEKETIDPCMTGDMKMMAEALSNTHANAQIPQFYGLLKEYEYTGDKKYWEAAKNFFHYVVNQQSFVIGGNSEWEQFREANNIYAQVTRRSAETCNTYNMLKIAKRLFEYTGDEQYVSYIERTLYNHILASIHTEHLGAFTYFVSLEPGYFKTYSQPYNSHWCCLGTGMENHANYGEFIYFYSGKNIGVNLYIASELNWKEEGFSMKMDTQFPYQSAVICQIESADESLRTLRFRCPEWTNGEMSVKVNGKEVESITQNGYISLERNWKGGDKVEIHLPCRLHIEEMPGNPDIVSYFYGPVLLAGKLGNEGMPASLLARGENDYTAKSDYNYKGEIPVFPEEADIDKVLTLTDQSNLRFMAVKENIEFVPFYSVMDERYSVYWRTEGERIERNKGE